MSEPHTYFIDDRLGGQDPAVRLVWGILKDGRCDLIAIATNDDALARYKDMGERNQNYIVVKDELVMLNHAFGAEMLPNAMNRARRR